MDKIDFSFIDIEIPDFDPEFFGLWIEHVVLSYEKELGNVSFVYCSDSYLLEMNKEHLDHDYLTDIITFNFNEGNSLSGDIFISYDRICENAKEFSSGSSYDELCRVMVHGVLHLVGFNDKSDEEQSEMTLNENLCLTKRKGFT